ncbi:MAG: IS21 family transposase, partial [Cyanobacteria bacterium]|nr:IS21 family transposase [Cyanobacteriota bacterium]
SQFCRRFRKWAAQRDLVMRQEHRAGEKLFVDFAGLRFPVTCRFTGEVRCKPVFVAVFGASNYCYAEACDSEGLRDWLKVHVRAFRFFGGCPQYVVPDNLKSAVTKAERFDPQLNKSYQRLAEHYGFGILPARPRKPKDKAKVEKGVQLVEQRVLAPMRNMTFFTLEDLNREIVQRVNDLNNEPFQKLSGSRLTWFKAVDEPELKPLPKTDFSFESWDLSVKVPRDYHICVENHFYSVPYRLVGELVDVRLTDTTIEVFHRNARISSHLRNCTEGAKTTLEEHMPASHAAYQGMSAEKFLTWAEAFGPSTSAVIGEVLKSKPHPQLCFDQCWGILRALSGKFGKDAVEKACHHALRLNSPGYRVVKSILESGVEKLPAQLQVELPKVLHPNIRGPNQFQ